MTALDGIERLETTALWRPEADAQRRDVYVAIGEAELVIQDRTGTALSHWSLPALVRRNPGTLPAVYAPARKAEEELEIAEPEMVAALDRVMKAVEQGRRRPGSLRRVTVGLIAGFLVGSALVWLPNALRDHARNVMPAATRMEIGDRMLTELTALTGPPCATFTGTEALEQLKTRVLPTTPLRLAVLRDLPQPAMALPGGLVVLSDGPLVTQDDPDVTAGHLLSATLAALSDPPLDRFLEGIGTMGLLRLLASGHVDDAAITAHVEGLLLAPPTGLDPDTLRAGFDAAHLAWHPWAEATGQPQGEVTPSEMVPSLDDTAWQALRGICDA
ncbi:hypothetical protein MWU52_02065 [Jannaschia sp. S6380]|uniref:hypothetical protein n=1 Tax=Jannaschia sp. S6380 TaxID=2926408 RepID=UPI001FF31B69|nr:hypothetical protein [Jannaschia sp. S6380]MCK0166328.1 hypothetical protein [Jannaschia sp. S6380]